MEEYIIRWLTGWAKRVKLTLDAGDIDADLTIEVVSDQGVVFN